MRTTLTLARAAAGPLIVRLALSVSALALIAPASVFAQSAPTFTACIVPLSGTLYAIGESVGPSACTKSTHAQITWNQTGPKGDKGDTGNQGIPGTPGTSAVRLWAVVNENSAIIKSSGGITIVRQGAGLYRLATTPDVFACVAIASIGFTSPSNNPQMGMVAVAITQTNQVSVGTFDPGTGTFADKPFVVAVMC